MLGKLFLTFTVFTISELALLVYLGGLIGFWWTLSIIVFTAYFGAYFFRLHGMKALQRIQHDLNRGVMPTDAFMDGLAVMIAGAFLITPGVITDGLGFLLLFPPSRFIVKKMWLRFIRRKLREAQQNPGAHQRVYTYTETTGGGRPTYEKPPLNSGPYGPVGTHPSPHHEADVIDITPED
jgi:UPF0716 protein FxsA